MFTIKIEIMDVVYKTGVFDNTHPAFSSDVVGEYIEYLCDSLVRLGLLHGNKLLGYKLTSEGREHASRLPESLGKSYIR